MTSYFFLFFFVFVFSPNQTNQTMSSKQKRKRSATFEKKDRMPIDQEMMNDQNLAVQASSEKKQVRQKQQKQTPLVKGKKKKKEKWIEEDDDDEMEIEEVKDVSVEKTKEFQKKRSKKGDTDSDLLDTVASAKILKLAAEQLEEEKEEERAGQQKGKVAASSSGISLSSTNSESEDDFSETEEDYAAYDFSYEADVRLSEAEERALSLFMSKEPQQRKTLADFMREKLEIDGEETPEEVDQRIKSSLKPEVVEVYASVGKILKSYTFGKLPKAFKILPVLKNWEEIMYITRPDEWSSCAVYQGTKIFASNMNAAMAQRFYNLVLLPRVRADIKESKRLNYHLYQALRKSVYKPAAFFKGIILPLCECDCTLKEAIIIASVVVKVSIPWTHSAAALMKIAQLRYGGASSIFMRAILNKKYALPYSVVDVVVKHFLSFVDDRRELPVLWHQCLYTFAQRYKTSLTREQKEKFKPLLRAHNHAALTSLIRNELFTSSSRGDAQGAAPAEMESG